MLHPLSVNVQCSIVLLVIYIYSHVIRHNASNIIFFASGFVNVILLKRHVCVGRKRNFTFKYFLVICLFRGLQFSFADRSVHKKLFCSQDGMG